MHRIRRTTVALVSTAALTLGAAPLAAHADDAPAEPCARQEAQVQKAEQALARVTAVFARQAARVKQAREDVAEADTSAEEADAKEALATAKAKKAHTAKVKKAQQMRLAKANDRLEACQAANPEAPAA